MNTQWMRWLATLLWGLVCAAIFRAWLAPENTAAWLQLLMPGFCS